MLSKQAINIEGADTCFLLLKKDLNQSPILNALGQPYIGSKECIAMPSSLRH